jgi:hypothetical protein
MSPQVNAAVGCLARMPLPHNAFRPIHHTSQPTAANNQPQQPLDRASSRFASELWAPYLRDTALRVFGSVGVTGQLGHFCRPVLDFTAGQHCTCLRLMSPAWLVACYRYGCNTQGCYVMIMTSCTGSLHYRLFLDHQLGVSLYMLASPAHQHLWALQRMLLQFWLAGV